MIYQHVNKRAKILPLATFHTAHLCKQFNQICITNFYATFQTHYFYQNSSKIKLFLKKNAKFSNAGDPPPDPQNSPPQLRILAMRLPHFVLFIIIWVFLAFVLNDFFLIVQLQTL